MSRMMRWLAVIIAVPMALHSIFIAYYGQYVDPELIRATMLFMCALVILGTVPLAERIKSRALPLVLLAWAVDFALIGNLGCLLELPGQDRRYRESGGRIFDN